MSVTGVTSVTDFLFLKCYRLTFIFPAFSSTAFIFSSNQFNQRYKCYKHYSIHFQFLLIRKTTVTSVTTLILYILSSILVLQVLQALHSFSISMFMSSYQINQCYRCYKCYNLDVLCPLNIYTSVTSVKIC